MKNFARIFILALALAGFTELPAQNAEYQIVAPQNHKSQIAMQEDVKTKKHASKNSAIEISNFKSSKTEKSAPKSSKAKSLKAKNSAARSRKSAPKNSAKSVPFRSAQKGGGRAFPPLRLEVSERAYYEDGAWKLSDPAPSSAGTEQARHPGRGFSFSTEFGSDAPRYKWQQKDGAGGGKSRNESALDILQNKMDTIKLDVEFRH